MNHPIDALVREINIRYAQLEAFFDRMEKLHNQWKREDEMQTLEQYEAAVDKAQQVRDKYNDMDDKKLFAEFLHRAGQQTDDMVDKVREIMTDYLIDLDESE